MVLLIFMRGIGDRLRERREEAGLEIGQVAQYENLSKSYISQLETGRKQPNVWLLLVKLARRYGCSTDYLLGLTDDPTPPRGAELPIYGPELVNLARQLSDTRRLELLRIAETLYELEQETAEGQPTLIERTLKRVKHGDETRIIGEDSE